MSKFKKKELKSICSSHCIVWLLHSLDKNKFICWRTRVTFLLVIIYFKQEIGLQQIVIDSQMIIYSFSFSSLSFLFECSSCYMRWRCAKIDHHLWQYFKIKFWTPLIISHPVLRIPIDCKRSYCFRFNFVCWYSGIDFSGLLITQHAADKGHPSLFQCQARLT